MEAGGGSRRIVIVEDQQDSREMMRVLLEIKGHVVFEAVDGPTGLAAIEREKPDVALVDIGLPVMSGYDVARRVREKPELNRVVLVALTGFGSDADVSNALKAGFDEHLTKPADPKRLDAILVLGDRGSAPPAK